MFCINCGKEIVNNYKFCINCGQEVNNTSSNTPNNNDIKKNNAAEKKEDIQVEYIEDEPIKSIMENNVVVPIIFGILLATILSIVCISTLNDKAEQTLKYNICKVEEIK